MTMVREMKHSDVPQVVLLGHRYYQENEFYKDCEYRPTSVAIYLDMAIASPSGITLVAEKDKKIVGGFVGAIATQWFGRSRIAYDQAFFIEPEHRGTILAFKLLKEFVRQAKAKEVEKIMILNTAGTNDQRVMDLYERTGFRKIGATFAYEGGK